MAKFLNTSGTTYYLEELIKNAQERLYLISPYLKLNDRVRAFRRQRPHENRCADCNGEYKLLETIAQQLGNNRNVSGRIDLFTELKACQSCSNVILEFRNRYPNIQLNIFTGK